MLSRPLSIVAITASMTNGRESAREILSPPMNAENLETLNANVNKIVKITTYDGEALLAKVVLGFGRG
jgi:hypothetical protein